jgi:hypothetical protein
VFFSKQDVMTARSIQALLLACAIAGLASLSGCGKPDNPNDYPVSHWLTDGEDCTRAAPAAIIKSGLPSPNFQMEETPNAASGVPPEQRIKTVDTWLEPTRLVIPAQVAYSKGAPPKPPSPLRRTSTLLAQRLSARPTGIRDRQQGVDGRCELQMFDG